MITFYVICGILCSIVLGGFISMLITRTITKWYFRLPIVVVLSLLIGFGFTALVKMNNDKDIENYNGGTCAQCGTNFELVSITHERYDGDKYFYQCENGHTIKTDGNMINYKESK
jgi:H+/Cl- antiporter ClcA